MVWFLDNADGRGENAVFEVTGFFGARRPRRTVVGRRAADREARELRRRGARDVRVSRGGGWWVTR